MYRHASLDKLKSLLIWLQHQSLFTHDQITTALFVADNLHMRRYGRPLYGETWLRKKGYLPVEGLLLRAVMRSPAALQLHPNLTLHSASAHEAMTEWAQIEEILSGSDLDALQRALDMLQPDLAQLCQAQAVWGDTLSWTNLGQMSEGELAFLHDTAKF